MTDSSESGLTRIEAALPTDEKDLQTLMSLSNVLHSFNELQPLLENLVDLAIQHLNAERGVVFLLDSRDELEPTAARSLYPDDLVDARKTASTVVQTSIQEREGIVTEDAQHDPRFESESAIHYNILSVVCVPLFHRGACQGALYLDHGKRKGAFSERDHQFLRCFADLAASAIVAAQEHESYRLENKYLREIASSGVGFEEIISNSPKIISILETVELVATSNVSVLIAGESGTGKELIARAIHFKSDRRDQKFVTQNCASIPETLLESELFGHKKGAYTGATHDKPGLFEVANKGTLFLDEIGDLSLSSQAKILRVLQEGEFRRIGDNNSIEVDVRIISATNKDLQEQIQKALFREDLFYRLNVVTIKIPPLRERKEDVPLIARHYLNLFSNRMGRRPPAIEKDAVDMLAVYDWPGNVRQLKNEMERIAILLQDGDLLRPANLSEVIQQSALLKSKGGGNRLKNSIDAIQKKMVLDALQRYQWNKTRAANDLGISRRGLLKMIERYELDRRKKSRKKGS